MRQRIGIRVCSFIPDDWVFFAAAPLLGVRHVEFEGDDRGFTPYTEGNSRFRTAQNWLIDFEQRKITYQGKTGITRARITWGNGHVSTHTAQAPSTCLSVSEEEWSEDEVRMRARSGCANPLVPGAPAADYDLTITVRESGQVQVQGRHDGFPAIEVYKEIDDLFTGIYLYDPYEQGKSLLDLMPPMEIRVDVSG